MMALLPLVSLVAGLAVDGGIRVTAPPDARAQLAGALADADSIDWVRADAAHRTVTFAIDHAGEAYWLVATIDGGAVRALAIRDAGRGSLELGALTWLADEMQDVAAIARLDVDGDGHVFLVTDDDRRYAVIPAHDTNSAVEARWAAAWS